MLVLAKQPLPGRVKTRLQAGFSPGEAAALAAAALERHPRAPSAPAGSAGGCSSSTATRPAGRDGLEVVPQTAAGSGRPAGRSVRRHAASGAAPSGRVLLIGMDTPQVTARAAGSSWGGADAVLGLSEDGGFWAIGLRGGGPDATVFAGIEMSTERTGAAQLAG